MCIKRRLLKNLKCLGKLVWVPLFFNWLLIPLLVAMAYGRHGLGGYTYATATQFLQYFTPILSAWWLLFSFAEYIEADGNEILFVHERVKVRDYLVLMAAYLASLIPPLAVFTAMFANMVWDAAVIAIDCVLFSAFAYLIVFCVRSVAVAFLSLIIYELITLFFVNGETVFGYFYVEDANPDMLVKKYLPLLAVALLALAGAVFANARFRRYN